MRSGRGIRPCAFAVHTQRENRVAAARALIHSRRRYLAPLLSTRQERIHVLWPCQGLHGRMLDMRVCRCMLDLTTVRCIAKQVGYLVEVHFDHLRLEGI